MQPSATKSIIMKDRRRRPDAGWIRANQNLLRKNLAYVPKNRPNIYLFELDEDNIAI
jgi:hypothetical protein